VPEIIVALAGNGGMPSVMGLLARMPGTLRCPFVLHQPVAPEKIVPYAKHLARIAKQPVKIVSDPKTTCRPGEILLVLGRHAIFTKKGELTLGEQGTEPNASALLASVAEVYGASAIGVVLAGKGSEGVEGLRALRRADAPVYAESPLSATINELPVAAVSADAVIGVFPVPQLAEQLFVLTALG
jgi:two-component system, chemotaxis family, protein-glutamate methylesterase/glutaminase